MKELLNVHQELEHLNHRLKRGSWALIIVSVVLTLVAVVLMLSLNWYSTNLDPLSSEGEAKIINITSGSSVNEIANQLEAEELIRSSTAFIWYVQSNGDKANLQAGSYLLSPTSSVETIVQQLSSGDVATIDVAISPGQRLDQLSAQLSDLPIFDEEAVQLALVQAQSHPLFANNPNPTRLEGYVFPDTYNLALDETIEDLLQRTFDNLNSKLTPEVRAQLEAQGLTVHEAIILASIIQKEVSDPEDQRTVAQIFLKRLEEGISLGADATFVYAARIAGEFASPDFDSPYNTRINTGLPPGPISNFNFSALEAIANPSNTDYLYFVSGDDGNTYYAQTEVEHQANVDQYCIELCSLETIN